MAIEQTNARHHSTSVNGVRLHYIRAGEGKHPVLLLHGWPQTSHEWEARIIPELAKKFTVIAPDLRGLGYSGKPYTGYDMNSVASDLEALVTQLGFDRVSVVAHDWGAAAGYALAAQHRDLVTQLAVMEMVLPGFGIMESAMIPAPEGAFLWHMGFQSLPDIPELLITGREELYLRHLFSHYAYDPTAVSIQDIQEYIRSVTELGALRAALGYYREFWTTAEQNRKHAQEKLTIPVLALGGDASLGGLTAQCFEMVATNVQGRVIPQCGHWVAAEQPDYLLAQLHEFLEA